MTRLSRLAFAAVSSIAALSVAGCGGPDLNTGGRSSSFDQGLSGNFSSFGQSNGRTASGSSARGRGTYTRFEGSFELPEIQGNPFDYTENDVMVTITAPDTRTVRVPAFFDGGKTWRVRFTPDQAGRHQLTRVQLNGREVQPEKFEKRDFDATGSPSAGFVRRDTRDKTRFVYDNGNSYYPLGQNVAFTRTVVTPADAPPPAPSTEKPKEDAAKEVSKDASQAVKTGDAKPQDEQKSAGAPAPAGIPAVLEKMGRAGQNWSRIWMTNWDGKNLEWPATGKPTIGRLDLDAARRWDAIVESAEKSGIRFQLVLQHHGQWSSRAGADPQWDANPWNKKNGGFLTSPDEFFSNSRAIALTKAKYRYIIARWGSSPSIMSWELFNEVENTDAVYHKHQDEVAAWHNVMAQFIRQQDPNKHLITSSSTAEVAALGRELDYVQPHSYVADPVSTVSDVDTKKLDRPIFFGEIGPEGGSGPGAENFIHRALWAGVMSQAGGAPGWWDWAVVEKENLYDRYRAVGEFVRQSGMLSKRGLAAAPVSVETTGRGTLVLTPGGGWSTARQTEFTVLPTGATVGLSTMPSYLQGSADRSMFPAATFKVDFPAAGTVTVQVDRVSKSGANVSLSVDGSAAADKALAASPAEHAVSESLQAKVAAGAHTIKLENTGADWARIRSITLAPYGPTMGVVAKSSKDYAALWVYGRDPKTEEKGKLTVSGLQNGGYKVTWWDTDAGKVLSEETATSAAAGLVLTTPSVKKDVAAWITRSNDRTASRAEPKKGKATK
jgi:hypothetical protein